MIITAFTYGTNYSILNPSIKTDQKIIDNKVLCLNIHLISLDYIDSLVVNSYSGEKKYSQVFVFNPNSKRISVECFFNLEGLNKKAIEFVIYKSGQKYQYKNNLVF